MEMPVSREHNHLRLKTLYVLESVLLGNPVVDVDCFLGKVN